MPRIGKEIIAINKAKIFQQDSHLKSSINSKIVFSNTLWLMQTVQESKSNHELYQ